MLRATAKSLWARKLRLSLSALAIVLGVAFVAGSLMFTAMLRDGFDSLLKGSFGDVNVIAEGAGIESLATPRLLSQDDADEVGAVAGVERATGIVSSYSVFPLAKDGSLLAFPGTPGIATNWHDTPAAGGQTGPRIVEGRAPEADDEVAIDPATVRRGGYAVGEDVRVSTPLDGIRTYRLVGTGTYGAGATAGSSYLFFTLDEARAIYKKNYWDKINADKLPPELRAIAFDTAVNQGPAMAEKLIQHSGGDPGYRTHPLLLRGGAGCDAADRRAGGAF